MSWAESTPSHLTDEIRRRVLRACQDSYDENSRRHFPEDLGDRASVFGQNVTYNARHLAARALEEIEDVTVIDSSRHGWWIEFEHRGLTFYVYLYKAPPGAASIHAVEFDSVTKMALSTENAGQVKLVIVNGELTQVEAQEATRLVIVMFGSPEEGFTRAVVGAPYRLSGSNSDSIDVRWAWSEPFEDSSPDEGQALVPDDRPGDSPQPFSLRLRHAA